MVDLASSVFPDSTLPFDIDNDLIDKCRDHLMGSYDWGRTEKVLVRFLNTICTAITAVSGKPILRVWNASYCDMILGGSAIH
jgi:hypothetical protein